VIRGYLEGVDRFQARGWAFDPDDPGRHLELEFVLNTKHLGTVAADLFRQDLVGAGIGDGDHGFVFTFPAPLDAAELHDVRAHTRMADGSRIELPQLEPEEAPVAEPTSPPALRFSGAASDPTQYPVFVLGSARSGTSAMARALLKIERYRGYEEGHMLDLLAHWVERLGKFYALKYDETLPGRNTMIEQVPIGFFLDGLNHIFVELIRQLLGEGHWIDKTPNSDTIYLAPRFLEIWPNARFVFMRRRALENLASRARKFPEYNFATNCQEWKSAMEAWLSVRDQLRGAAIEVDQMYLSRHPQEVADQLRVLLDLDEVETRVIAQSFAHDRPQRTAATLDNVLDLNTMDWAEPWIAEFNRVCGPLMEQFGYTTDASYHRDGIAGGGLVLI
jgi:hypothetical protein